MKYVNYFVSNIFDKIQLSILYLYIIYDLFKSLLTLLFNNDYKLSYLNLIEKYIPKKILNHILSSHGAGNNYINMYFFSYFILDTLIINPKFNFSLLVKYNILLVISLIFLKSILLSYCQLLFSLPLPISKTTTSFLRNPILEPIVPLSIFNIMSIIQINLSFIIFYIIAYIYSLNGKFIQISSLNWIFDSIAFWLKIKTPTMNF